MKTQLDNLSNIEKLRYAVECMEHDVSFPTDIRDFLVKAGLYDLITNTRT